MSAQEHLSPLQFNEWGEADTSQLGIAKTDVPHPISGWAEMPTERVPVDRIKYSHQSYVTDEGMEEMANRRRQRVTDDPNSTVRLYSHKGDYAIYDGNHRVVRAKVKGSPTVLARVSR